MDSNRINSPYQLVHLIKLLSNKSNGLLITDGVGVGKTISAGYVIAFHLTVLRDHVAVVCPTPLVQKWRLELRDKFGFPSIPINNPESILSVVEETTSKETIKPRIYIIPYSFLSRSGKGYSPRFSLIIFDEIHTIRNPYTKAYLSSRDLAKNTTQRIGMTATPIHNKLTDLAAELSILFPSYSLETLDAALTEIWMTKRTRLLHPWTTRFLKDELSIHFTKRVIYNHLIRFPKEYTSIVEDMVDSYLLSQRKNSNIGRLNAIIKFRLASSSPYAFFESFNTKSKINWTDTKVNELLAVLASVPNERWIVFCEFVLTASYLARAVQNRPVYLMTGESNMEEREAVTRKFRENDNSVLILTSVGSEGLDFQVASRLINYDLHWNPMVLEQRIGRIDRIGQMKEEINIYNFIVDGSIDSDIINTLGKKLALIANTFAEPGRIIKSAQDLDNSIPTSRLVFSDESLYQQEKISAERYLSTELLAKNLPKLDYELAKVLPSELCKIEGWPKGASEWAKGFPLLPNISSVDLWSTQLLTSLDDLSTFLSFYK